MKKFWIFILGVITAIVGFFIFTDKTPTADTPPINNEQQQPGDNTGDDNTGDVTPDDPSNVGGTETQYTTNTFYLNDSQVVGLEYYLNDICSTVDISNGLDNLSLVVGAMHGIHVSANDGFALTSLIYNGETIWSGYNINLSSSFTPVENGTLEVTTCEKRQSFNVDELEISCNSGDFSATYYLVGIDEAVNTLEVGNRYRIELNLNVPDYVFTNFSGNCSSDVDCSYTSSTFIIFEVNDAELPIFWAHVCHNTDKTTVEVEPLEYIDSWSVDDMAGNKVENVWGGESYSFQFTVASGYELNSYMIIQDGNVLRSETFEFPFSGTECIPFFICDTSSPITFCFDGNMVE